MDIQAGEELRVIIKGCKSPLKTVFVGEKSKEHIVVVLPQQLTFPENELARGREICAQYSVGENRYEFKTRIREILTEPTDLILLEYPKDVHTAEKRSRKRITCLVSAKLEFRIEEKDELVIGVIKNISKTGCRSVFKRIEGIEQPFSLNDRVSLKCQFPGFPGEQTALGKIVHLQEEKEEILAGIQFEEELWWVPPYYTDKETPSAGQ